MAPARITNCTSLVLSAFLVCLTTVSGHAANGIILDVIVHEVLEADPPETAAIDSVSYPVFYDRMTTMRAGNFVLDVTARTGDGGSVELAASAYVSGPLPGHHAEEANILPGAALIIEGIRGKGKSTYRARLVPHPADLPADTLGFLDDSLTWQPVYSLRARYLVPTGVLPQLQFLPVRGMLDYEFNSLLDTLDADPTGRLLVYLAPGQSAGWPYEPEYGYAIDPSRYRVIARHTPLKPEITTRALALAAMYRSWGYAPQLLASGIAGYPNFSDYDLRKDHDAGQIIPLDSLARSIDYKLYDRHVADHHAESFVAWLLNTYGIPHFKDLYERATDLSIHRAIWAVYGRTLSELEKDWLKQLESREFYREEFEYYAQRAEARRDFTTHLELLQQAAAVITPATPEVLRGIGIAQAHLGRFKDAVSSFSRLVSEYPDDKDGRWFLAESQRAVGDDIAAWKSYTDHLRLNSFDPQVRLRLGDMQWEARRVDSAASYWRAALSSGPSSRLGAELRLRMGGYFQERRKGQDSALANFAEARRLVQPLVQNSPLDPSGWIISAEALLGLDSCEAALPYLDVAQSVTDAAIDVGRIRLACGKCLDKLKRRDEAVAEYDAIIAGASQAPMVRQARKYLNRAYGR